MLVVDVTLAPTERFKVATESQPAALLSVAVYVPPPAKDSDRSTGKEVVQDRWRYWWLKLHLD